MRFGLDDGRPMTLEEIGSVMVVVLAVPDISERQTVDIPWRFPNAKAISIPL